MPFDYLMGVGRTRKITNDVYFNPNILSLDNLQNYSFFSKYKSFTISGIFRAGTDYLKYEEMIDLNLPDTNASFINSGGSGAGSSYMYIDFDSLKNVYYDSVCFNYSTTVTSTLGGTIQASILGSDDGTNYNTLSTETLAVNTTTSIPNHFLYAKNIKNRYFRIRFDYSANSGYLVLTVHKIKYYYSNMQYQ